jgi:hypothetical protein
MSALRTFSFAFASLLITTHLNAAQVKLSASLDKIIPLETYTCQEKVYAHVDWDGMKPGKHHLEAIWRLPDGKVQERTAYDFAAPAQNAVVWLEAEKPPVFSGPVRWSGRWNVEVFLDGRSLGTLPFEMSC